MNKVFLGGTTNKTTWRDQLIPQLKIDYFNPVVEDWTEDCIKLENEEKQHKCNIHLYVITKEMIGVYSIAEAVQSSLTNCKTTVFCILDKDSFNKSVLKSLIATEELLSTNGAIICNSLQEIATFLNSFDNGVKMVLNLDYILKEFKRLQEMASQSMSSTFTAFGGGHYPIGVVQDSKVKDIDKVEKEEDSSSKEKQIENR
jgi:hypothetical protein